MMKIEGIVKKFSEGLYYGYIPQIKGLVVQGESKDETLRELLLSLRVKLAYDFGIDMSKIKTEERDISEIKYMQNDISNESIYELASI